MQKCLQCSFETFWILKDVGFTGDIMCYGKPGASK